MKGPQERKYELDKKRTEEQNRRVTEDNALLAQASELETVLIHQIKTFDSAIRVERSKKDVKLINKHNHAMMITISGRQSYRIEYDPRSSAEDFSSDLYNHDNMLDAIIAFSQRP